MRAAQKEYVVIDTTKIQLFKQITTLLIFGVFALGL